MAVGDWSNTASSNTTIGAITIGPNCDLGNIDNAIREMMKQIKDWYDTVGMPSGSIILWSGSIASIPSGWVLCNGANGTPDLRNMFVVGAGSTYSVADTGGATTHTHTVSVSNASTGASISTNGANVNADSTPPFCLTSATLNDPTHTHTASTGSGSNLPPYYALAYIMKS